MSKVDLIDLRQPLSWHVLEALRYPLRASALPGLVVFTLAHYLSLLPVAGWLLVTDTIETAGTAQPPVAVTWRSSLVKSTIL